MTADAGHGAAAFGHPGHVLAAQQPGGERAPGGQTQADVVVQPSVFLLDALAQMLSGSRLVRGVEARIADGMVNAEAAVQHETSTIAKTFASMVDPYLAARVQDVREVGRRMNSLAQGGRPEDVAETIAWLEKHLRDYPGSVLIITHDRYFLDNVAQWILELDRGHAYPYEGNYSVYLEKKAARLKVEGQRDAKLKKRLTEELEWVRSSARAQSSAW